MQNQHKGVIKQLALMASDRERVAILMGKMVEREMAVEKRRNSPRKFNRRPPSNVRKTQKYRGGSSEFVAPIRPRIFWKGADIIIADRVIPDYHGSSIIVVSSEARHISRLLRALRNLNLNSLDWFSKLEFYGRIAERLTELDDVERNDRVKITQSLFDGALAVLRLWESRLVEEG